MVLQKSEVFLNGKMFRRFHTCSTEVEELLGPARFDKFRNWDLTMWLPSYDYPDPQQAKTSTPGGFSLIN